MNVVVPDTPTNENDVDAPGTTIETQPPLFPAFPLLNTLLVNVNVDMSLVATLLRMLTAPPSPFALTSVNVDPVTVVVIPMYVSLISEIAPPFWLPLAPVWHRVNVLDDTLTVDDVNVVPLAYRKLRAPPCVVELQSVNELVVDTSISLLLAPLA